MRKIYEFTEKKLSSLHTPAVESADIEAIPSPDTSITRQNIFPNGTAYILSNFLRKAECQNLIGQAESLGFEDCGYSKSIRRTDRVAAVSTEIAYMLFSRLTSFLAKDKTKDEEVEDGVISFDLGYERIPEGFPRWISNEKWTAYGLNPCFRLCRYESSGFFLPHHDGGFLINSDNQSLQTFMVYLNDDFEGGETNFYNELQRHYHKPDQDNVVCSYKPQAGDVIIFNSQITHDGARVRKGRKYIFRSEVMFKTKNADKEEVVAEADHDKDAELTWP